VTTELSQHDAAPVGPHVAANFAQLRGPSLAVPPHPAATDKHSRTAALPMLSWYARRATPSTISRIAPRVQGLAIRIARRVNSALKRRGKLFGERFHARTMTTPRDVRNTLRYVLLDRKHHAAGQRFYAGWIDPYSSGVWFRGWAAPIRLNSGFDHALSQLEAPTREPRTWLLRVGWRRAGPLSYDERPS